MKDLFVPYEIAKKFKKLGFDEPCISTYSTANNDGNGDFTQIDDGSWIRNSEMKYGYTAPLWQQAIDWLRVEHNLEVSIKSWKNEGDSKIIYVHSVKELGKPSTFRFDDKSENYYEILERVIVKALKLIK